MKPVDNLRRKELLKIKAIVLNEQISAALKEQIHDVKSVRTTSAR